jgi:hypothetical protein
MDFSPENRRVVGDLKNSGSLLRELSEGFKGVVRMTMVREGVSYDAELVLQNNFIIAASLKCPADGTNLRGEKAFRRILDYVKESSGDVVAYELSNVEFKSYVSGNDAALLELVRDFGKTLEGMGRVDEDVRKDGLLDLEMQWKELESRWKQFEEKEKPYLEMILKEDLRDRSYSRGGVKESFSEEPPEDNSRKENPEHEEVPAAAVSGTEKTGKEEMHSSEETEAAANTGYAGGASRKNNAPSGGVENSADEKTLDEMILREDPWERIPSALASGGQAGESGEKAGAAPGVNESSETDELRRELRGDYQGGDSEEEREAHASSERTLSDDFNERVQDAILGRKRGTVSKNAVSHGAGPAQAVEAVGEGESQDAQKPKVSQDEWLTRANETLQRLKKKREEAVMNPPEIRPDAEVATEAANAQKELTGQAETAPQREGVSRETESGDLSTAEEAGNKPPGELINNTSSEINEHNKSVDVYWGWDKRKKRFVGIEGVEANGTNGEEPGKNKAATPSPDSKAPANSCTVLREELKKQTEQAQQAQAAPREIVIKKEELIQAQEVQPEEPAPPPTGVVPELKKKIGFMDKLKYAKYPQIVKVLEKVNGKKTVDDLSTETGLTPATVKYVVEKLAADGYLNLKEGV